MVGRNERKLQVLEYVKMCQMTTSSELALALTLEIHNARTGARRRRRIRDVNDASVARSRRGEDGSVRARRSRIHRKIERSQQIRYA